MNHSAWKTLLLNLLLMLFYLNHAAGNSDGSQIERIKQLNQNIEQAMIQSKNQVESGEYGKANESTKAALQGLDILIEAFMPIDDRIKKLLENENSILHRTRKITSGNNKMGVKDENLVHDQIVNREKTEKTSELVARQIAEQKTGTAQNSNPESNTDNQETFGQIKQLLDEAASFQTEAINHLEDDQYSAAIPKEEEAIDKLKKALEKLKQESDSQNSKDSQDSQDQQKQSNDKTHQEKGQQKEDSEGTAEENKKMTAEEALKELARLNKQANDEMKKRQEKYGVSATTEQVPVDKDW